MRVNSTCRPAWTGPRVRGRRFWVCLCEAGTRGGPDRTRAAFEAAASSGGGAPRCRTAPSAHGGSGQNRRRREGEFSPFACCPLSGGGSRRLRPLGRTCVIGSPGSQALGLRLTVAWGPGVQTADGGTSRPPEPRAPTPRPRLILFFWRTLTGTHSIATPTLSAPLGWAPRLARGRFSVETSRRKNS